MPEKSRLPHVKALVDAFKEADDRKDSWVSEKMGQDRRLLSSWWNRGLSEIPSPALLWALADAIRTDYRDVLDAALLDFSYLPASAARTLRQLEDAADVHDLSLPPDVESRPS